MSDARSITIDVLLELRDFVDEQLDVCDCDACERTRTFHWLRARNYDVEDAKILIHLLSREFDDQISSIPGTADFIRERFGNWLLWIEGQSARTPKSDEYAHWKRVIERTLEADRAVN